MREERDGRDLCKIRRLKSNQWKFYPSTRTVDPEPDVGHKAKGQEDGRGGKPHPPCALPELVVDDRANHAGDDADAEPEGLAFQKVNGIAMAVLREGARAEKHHESEDDQRRHGKDQEVDAFAMHDRSNGGPSRRYLQFQADLQLSYIAYVIQPDQVVVGDMQLASNALRRITVHDGISQSGIL